jgi:hypothetical protein
MRGIVALALALLHLGRGQSEEEEVLRAHLFANLDVGPVQRADGQRAVHGELHVAGSRGFLAGQRNLLAQVGGGIDALPQLHAVIGQKDDLEPALHQRVGVDHLAHGVNQLDDQLGHAIAGRGLAAEEEGARHDLRLRVALDALVEGEDVQHLQVLALVLVQPLDQHVEHGLGIDGDAQPLLNVGGQLQLVVPLDGSPLLGEARGRRPAAPAAQLFQIAPSPRPAARQQLGQPGLLSTIQRRGVTPLVLLENFSGVSA